MNKHRRIVPRVYMAGQMNAGDQSDWRQEWRPPELLDIPWDDPMLNIGTPVTWAMIRFTYVGPYGDGISNHSFVHGCNSGWDAGEKRIFDRAIRGIYSADFVIAVVDTVNLTCHGTLAEIGFAHGIKTPVHLVMLQDPDAPDWDYDRNPAWFITHMARRVHYASYKDKAKTAMRAFVMAFADWVADIEKNEAAMSELLRELKETA